jgi:Restriction endonuclease
MTSSWRTSPLPKDWQRTRRRILARDGHKCRVCRFPGFEVDHIIPARLGGSDRDDNLWTLCKTHHKAKTGREAADGSRNYRAKKKHPPEAHPGLIEAEETDDQPGVSVY